MSHDPAGGAAAAPCCAASNAASASSCVLCLKAVCAKCWALVNGKKTCGACRDAVLAEIAQENSDDVPLARSVGAGLTAALACGAAWALLGHVTGSEIGIAAVGVGWLVAQAIRLASERKRGARLFRAGIACSLLGLLLGKYFMVAEALRAAAAKRAPPIELGYFDLRVLMIFVANFFAWFSFYDLLWAFLAYRAVARVLAPVKVLVGADARGNPPPAA